MQKKGTYDENPHDIHFNTLENTVYPQNEMPEDFVIKKFLLEKISEVKNMFLTEYDEEKVLAQERQEGKEEGIKEAYEEAEKQYRLKTLKIIQNIIKLGKLTSAEIANIYEIPEEEVIKLMSSTDDIPDQ